MHVKPTAARPHCPIPIPARLINLRRLACAGVLVLSGCRTPAPSSLPLLGTWRSDKELTLLEVEKTNLTEKQRDILSGPGFFGERTIHYEVGRARSEVDGNTTWWMPYRVVKSGKKFVEIECMDPATGEMVRRRILFDGDLMKMPIRTLGFYEVFRRVKADQQCSPALIHYPDGHAETVMQCSITATSPGPAVPPAANTYRPAHPYLPPLAPYLPPPALPAPTPAPDEHEQGKFAE